MQMANHKSHSPIERAQKRLCLHHLFEESQTQATTRCLIQTIHLSTHGVCIVRRSSTMRDVLSSHVKKVSLAEALISCGAFWYCEAFTDNCTCFVDTLASTVSSTASYVPHGIAQPSTACWHSKPLDFTCLNHWKRVQFASLIALCNRALVRMMRFTFLSDARMRYG